MADIKELSGGCLCGAVRFTAFDVVRDYHACHCEMCRRWGGSAFMGVDVGRVEFAGDEALVRHHSSEWAARGFCSQCGSSLFYYFKPANRYSVCAGAFDDQSGLRLSNEIFIDMKPAGYGFAGNLPCMTEAETIAKFTADPQ